MHVKFYVWVCAVHFYKDVSVLLTQLASVTQLRARYMCDARYQSPRRAEIGSQTIARTTFGFTSNAMLKGRSH